jgi:preprotein translocase subunit SecB
MKTKKASPAELPAYASFLKSLEIFSISLTDSTFHGNRDEYFENRKHELDVDWRAELAGEWEQAFDVRVNVTIKISPPKKGKDFFKLTAEYLLHVHAPAPLDRQHVKRFTGSEVRLIVWPYVREYATSLFGRMHVPPAILPVAGAKGA